MNSKEIESFFNTDNTDPQYENLTDIDENFLAEIEDTGPITHHTLQSRRITEEEIPLNTVTQQPSCLINNLQEQLNKSTIKQTETQAQVDNKIKCIFPR